MEIVRAIAIGLSVTFLVWVGAVAFASSRLVWANWPLLMKWRQQSRNTRVSVALWIALPGIKVWMFWMRGVLLWVLITQPAVVYVTPFAIVQSIVVLPFVLIMIALMLWWVCDRAHGAELGDRVWWWLVLSGIAAGAGSASLSWWLL